MLRLIGTLTFAVFVVWHPELSGEEPNPAAPILTDGAYRTACGPIACYVALRSLKVDTSLRDTVEGCGWAEGKLTTLDTMAHFLNGHEGVHCIGGRLSPQALKEFLELPNRAAILAVRTIDPEVPHAVAVLNAGDGRLAVVDYPQLIQVVHPNDLTATWDGEALLVSRAAAAATSQIVLWAVLPGLSVAATFCLSLAVGQRRKARPPRARMSTSPDSLEGVEVQ